MSPAPSRLASTRPRAPRLLAVGVASSLYSAGPPGSRTRTYPIGPSALISSHCFHAADELSGTLDSAKPIIAATGVRAVKQDRAATRTGPDASSPAEAAHQTRRASVVVVIVPWKGRRQSLARANARRKRWCMLVAHHARLAREARQGGSSWASGSNGCKTYIWRRAPGVQARGRLRSAPRGGARGTPRARAGRRAIRFARERGKARERRVAIAACGAAMEGLELRLAALERSSEQLC